MDAAATTISAQRAGLQAYGLWALRPSSVVSASSAASDAAFSTATPDASSGTAASTSRAGRNTSSSSAAASEAALSKGRKQKGFSLRLGKFSLSYQEVEDTLAPVVDAARELAGKRAKTFDGELEIAALRDALHDPDQLAAQTPLTGIMQRKGVEAYRYMSLAADTGVAARGALIGVA